jgi:hypothetical protein
MRSAQHSSDNKSKSVAHELSLQAKAGPSAQRKMAAVSGINSGLPAQLQTDIVHTVGNYAYNHPAAANEVVGDSVVAYLDPVDQVDGSDTGQNAAVHNALMTSVRHFNPAPMVKGHLLNAHLGGDAMAGNLYPITVKANNDHKMKVEYAIKAAVAGGGAEYRVNVVNAAHNDGNPDADFACQGWHWDPAAPLVRGAQLFDITIQSRPSGYGAIGAGPWGGADDNNNPGNVPPNLVNPGDPAGWNATIPDPAHAAARNRGRVAGL